MGRSIAVMLVLLVAGVVVGALFLTLDVAAGLHVTVPRPFASSPVGARKTSSRPRTGAAGIVTPPSGRATPAPSASVAATATVAVSATATSTATPSAPTATSTPWPTPPGGVSPPIYGTLLDYPNNTIYTPTELQDLDARIRTLTNSARADHGLGALADNTALDVVAAARSEDMIKRGYFSHFDPTGPLDAQGRHVAAVQELLIRNHISYTQVGENLVDNTALPLNDGTPNQVVQAWLHHAEHRANIMNARFTSMGVGMAAEMEAGTLRVIITQIFIQ